MKISSIIKKVSAILGMSLVTVAAIVGLSTSSASAAQRYDYNSNDHETTTTPIFNAFYNVPVTGDEADFVRIRNSNGDPTASAATYPFVSTVTSPCSTGSMYDIRTYVHNGASPNSNENGTGSAIAHNTRVAMTAPTGQVSNSFVFSSTISAENAESVSDSTTLSCGNKRVKLELVASTVYSSTTSGWVKRSDSAVNGSMKIGSHDAESGEMWACWDERVMVVYTVKVVDLPAPTYTCDALAAVIVGNPNDRKYRFTTNTSVANGATVAGYKYNYGDGTTVTQVTDNAQDHVYAKDGTYNASVEVVFNVPANDGSQSQMTVTGPNCKVEIKISPEMCAVPGKGNLPKSDPNCKVDEKCTVAGKTNLNKNDANCKETVKSAVTTLPNTGAGSIAGLLAVVTIAGALAHRWFTLRQINR